MHPSVNTCACEAAATGHLPNSRHLRSHEDSHAHEGAPKRSRLRALPPPTKQPTSLPVKRQGVRVGTASSAYVPERLQKCFWARSSSCRCSTPAKTDGRVTGQPGPKAQGRGDHTQAEDPMSCLDGKHQKEDVTSGQGEGRGPFTDTLYLMGGAGTSGLNSFHHLSHREAAAC